MLQVFFTIATLGLYAPMGQFTSCHSALYSAVFCEYWEFRRSQRTVLGGQRQLWSAIIKHCVSQKTGKVNYFKLKILALGMLNTE